MGPRIYRGGRSARPAAVTAVLIAGIVLLAAVGVPARRAAASPAPDWVPAFTSAMAWSPGRAGDVTVRQVVPLSVGGALVRVQLANTFSGAALAVGAASVAVQSSGPQAVTGSVRALSFGGEAAVTIPAGGTVWSDPVAMTTHAGEDLLVSAWVPGQAAISSHYDAGPMSYATVDGGGDLAASASGSGFGLPSTWDRWVATVDVAGGVARPGATVVFGDSISDGFNIACGHSDICQATTPWPVFLQQRIRHLPASRRTSVVDESITANTLTAVDTPLADRYRVGGGGPPGLTRMAADVLDQPGVARVLLLIGTNDLWFGASAAQLIAGYKAFAARAAARGVEVIASTLLPREGSKGWTPADEKAREVVNHWILTSHTFPVVLDLAAVVADTYGGACQPDRMYPPYNSGDWLHPDTAGQLAMADAVPTGLLGAPGAPELAKSIPAVPTTGCPHPAVLQVDRASGSRGSSTSASSSTTSTSGTTTSAGGSSTTSTSGAKGPGDPGGPVGRAAGGLPSGGSGPGGVHVGAWVLGVAVLGVVALRARRRIRRALRRRRRSELQRRHGLGQDPRR